MFVLLSEVAEQHPATADILRSDVFHHGMDTGFIAFFPFFIYCAVYEERKERYETRIHAMVEYVTSENVCRSRMLLRYFGEKNEHNCGQCDVCLSHRAEPDISQSTFDGLREQICALLKEHPMTPAEIASHINTDKEQLSEVIRFMLDEGLLSSENGLLTEKTS